MPIDHTSITVSTDVHKKTVDFYLEALKPLGYEKLLAFGPNEESVGLGVKPRSDFWIIAKAGEDLPTCHIAFTAKGNPFLRPLSPR